ncbi:MAG TPA: tetratricopeptide repeat protein [Kiritimatiellia bacterium]|nr:tetratricopeptide repeat protein [Kiritimatiellia bacterium]
MPPFRLFAHGLFAGESTAPTLFAYALNPQAMVGIITKDVVVSLESSLEVTRTELSQHLAIGNHHIYLVLDRVPQGTAFCLLQTDLPKTEALPEARSLLEGLSLADFNHAFRLRVRWSERLAEASIDPSATLHAVEKLVSRLRPVKDPDHLITVSDRAPAMITAESTAIITAWSRLDLSVAERHVNALCAAIDERGLLPSLIGSPTDGSPAPFLPLAQLALSLSNLGTSPQILKAWYPAIQRHLAAAREMLSGSEPPHWPAPTFSLLPEIYTENPSPLDAQSHLIAELACLHRIAHAALPKSEHPAPEWIEHLTRLREFRESHTWSDALGFYRHTPATESGPPRITLDALTPLSDPELPPARRAALLARAQDPAYFLDPQRGLRCWIAWDSDPTPPPVQPVPQHLILLAASGPENRVLFNALRDAIASASPDPSLLAACLKIQTTLSPPSRFTARNSDHQFAEWLNQHRLHIAAAAILFGLISIIGIYAFISMRTTLTPSALESRLARAQLLADDNRQLEALDLLKDLEQRGHRHQVRIYARIAILYYKLGNYEQALGYFEHELQDPRSPPTSVHMNHALTLYRLGRFEQAAQAYRIIARDWEQDLPTAAFKAGVAAEMAERRLQEQKNRRLREERRGELENNEGRDAPRRSG